MVIDCYQIESCKRTFNERYKHFIHQTPLWKLPGRAHGVHCAEVWLKLEHLQTGGSFKARGMLNRLLSQPIPSSGVIVASGGNAGIATAAAARELGVPCEVFVPEISGPAKRAWLAALGAQVVVVGGGLIGGVASWFGQRSRVVALEPEQAPGLFRAREAGRPVDVEVGGIAADSLGARRIGSLAWDITQAQVRDALLLTDESIRAAQLWLWKELKLAVEPAAALPLAALHSRRYLPRADDTVCLVFCGANVDPASLN